MYWESYENIREGHSNSKFKRAPSIKVGELQELAIAMNKGNLEEKKEKKEDKKEESKALEEVDELSRKFKPGNNPDPVDRKCCNCSII